jgi:TonB-linked SusC/RagA family outer membrane protein
MKKYILLPLAILAYSAGAQEQRVSGRIIDDASEPVVGASITLKGATIGVTSGINGDYDIDAPLDGTLTFSFLGYETREEAINGRTRIDIVLHETSQAIDEVVIVGASLRKSDLTGAVASVSSKTLEEKPVTNINDALQGRVAGVFISQAAKPGDNASIKIRGTNTLTGTTDPIYVVDGLVMDNHGGGYNSINVNDVQSIEVLKDASATALYGSRASNGVVLITTKKGTMTKGKGEGGTLGRISYDGWVGISQYANIPKKMDTKQLYELRRTAHINGWLTSPANNPAILDAYVALRVDNGTRVFAEYEKEAYRNNDNYDWLAEISQTGVQQDHLVSFTGGSDRNSYYLSFGYADQQGLVKKTELQRYTGRINAEQVIKSWFKAGTNTSLSRSFDMQVDDAVVQRAWNANPMLPIDKVPTGLADNPNNVGKIGRELYTLNYRGVYDQNWFNPLNSLRIDNHRWRDRIISSNYLNFNPIDGLNVRSSFMMDYLLETRYRYVPGEGMQEPIRNSHHGQANQNYDKRFVWQWDNSINYERSFGSHKINLLLSTSATSANRTYTYVTGNGFANDLLSYYRINDAFQKDRHDIGSEFIESSLLSYVGRANYSYAGKYILTATLRYDGSSKFAPDKRWGSFPSVSAAWNIMEESFMQNLGIRSVLGSAKLRAGFGIAGNQEIGDYAYYTLYGVSVSQNSGQYDATYLPQDRKGNPDITWEKQQQYNVGMDLSLLNQRLLFSADFFYINNKDLLMQRSLPTTTGFKYIIENVGAINNKGIEFSLNANVLKISDFKWDLGATFSLDRNKVTELNNGRQVIYNFDGDRNLQKEGNLFVGQPKNTLYILQTGGIAQAYDFTTDDDGNTLFQGKPVRFVDENGNTIDRWNGRKVSPGDLYPVDASGDGQITNDDRVIIGSTDPKFYGGFSTEFSWKGLSLNAVFTYSYGAKKLSPYYEGLIGSTGSSAASADLVGNMWSQDNTGAEFPRPVADFDYPRYGIGDVDFLVQDGSFLRLSALTLAYTFPIAAIGKLKMSNLRVYATGSNLFCLTPYKGYDPETGDWYPPTRMWVFGLNISF